MADLSEQWLELTETVFRARLPRLVENVAERNALLKLFPSKPLTRVQKLRRWVRRQREALGFWIAGIDPDDFDG